MASIAAAGCVKRGKKISYKMIKSALAGHCDKWSFDCITDLCVWRDALDAMDEFMGFALAEYPRILLIPDKAAPQQAAQDGHGDNVEADAGADAGGGDDDRMRDDNDDNFETSETLAVSALCDILGFSYNLLKNCVNKHIYNSSSYLILLLSSRYDDLSNLSLTAVCGLAAPPMLQRYLNQEQAQHNTHLHNSHTAGEKLMLLAKGWGSHTEGWCCLPLSDFLFLFRLLLLLLLLLFNSPPLLFVLHANSLLPPPPPSPQKG